MIGSFHFHIFFLSSIIFNFLIEKYQNIILDFNLLTFHLVDMTSTHRYSKFKYEFEELSIKFFICEFAHSMIVFLCLSRVQHVSSSGS